MFQSRNPQSRESRRLNFYVCLKKKKRTEKGALDSHVVLFSSEQFLLGFWGRVGHLESRPPSLPVLHSKQIFADGGGRGWFKGRGDYGEDEFKK